MTDQVQKLLAQGKRKEAANVLSDLGAACRDDKQARAYFEQCLRLDELHFEAQANLALMDLEDAGMALRDKIGSFQRALKINPRWFDGLKTLASLLDDAGNELASVEMYRNAAKFCPNDCDVLFDLALILAKSGDLRQAVEACKSGLKLNPKHGKGNLLLGELLWRSGASPKQAVIFCQRALEFARANQQEQANREVCLNACLLAATAMEQQGEEGELAAIQFLQMACQVSQIDTTTARLRLNAVLFAARSRDDADWHSILRHIPFQDEEDLVGRAMLHAFLNEPLPSAAAAKSQQKYSQLCEAFLLNSHFNDSYALIHKVSLYRNTAAVNSNALPKSYIVSSWNQVQSKLGEEGLYFLKNPAVQRGQGILLINARNAPNAEEGQGFFGRESAQDFLLQEAVHPPLLLHGQYKFGLRTHALLVQFPNQSQRSVFVFRESILTRCWAKYDVESTDALVHISSTSVQRGVEGFDRNLVKGLASQMFPKEAGGYELVFDKLKPKIFECIRACMGRSSSIASRDRPMLQLFGFDSMVRAGDLEPFIAEANAAPQFQDSKRTQEMLQGFAIPMTHGACELLCNGFDRRQARETRWDWVGEI